MRDSTPKPSLEELLKSKKLSNPSPDSWSAFHDKVKLKTLDSLHGSKPKITLKNASLSLLVLTFSIFLLTSYNFQLSISDDHSENSVNPIVKTSENPLVLLEEDLDASSVKFVENNYFSASSKDYEKTFAIENYKIEVDPGKYSFPLTNSDKTMNDVLSHTLTF